MKVTDDLDSWLSSASLSLIDICNCDLSFELAQVRKTKLYSILYSNVGLGNRSILGGSFDHATQAFSSLDCDITALLFSPADLTVAFFVFDNDDKYILANAEGLGYQDSDLYSKFYSSLTYPESAGLKYSAKKDDLWIMPRAQYGHFIFDEVLPAITSYFIKYSRPPARLRLIASRLWQIRVLEALSEKIFNIPVEVVVHHAPTRTTMFQLSGGILVFPSYWRTFLQARRLLHAEDRQKRLGLLGSKIFLTREGFDPYGLGRVLNIKEVRSRLTAQGFICLAPHDFQLRDLFDLMSQARIVVSEPGTTPLISYICTSAQCRFLPLLSFRCLTDCSPRFTYSGWRYHIPWLDMVLKVSWGFPETNDPNPFADRCWYNEKVLTSIT